MTSPRSKNNEFIITKQVNYDGREGIRTDIILYVNGIPLVDIECKNPTDPSVSWYDAYRQIKDYEGTVPELYKYIQIGSSNLDKDLFGYWFRIQRSQK